MPQESKEKEILAELFPGEEKYPVVEEKEPELPPGVETHLEKIEKELHTVPTVRDGWGRVLAQPPTPKKVKITLPITRQQYLAGFHRPVVDSIKWLVVWIGRLVKIFPGRVSFRSAKA